ncbi:hypothetical protein [Marinoscillum furvescens]|uniref:Uncharacterized protein n=1 Tax=Marinoscillum furvescens DSM 4134 TaxID=1122208 RepID=A0A3D9L5Z3_MARFU|nr:hypothetical protein [Marinoscillum furvescens]REE01106.1 hypothetical protein C7460_104126 [Marinoscillum furvescens DSM 4134]
MNKTEGLLIQQLVRQGIGVTHELRKQLHQELRSKGEGYLEGEFTMLTYGRYVDMGVGRGKSLGMSTRGSLDLDKGRKARKPKKWYSKTFYGRLYDLYGAIGYQISQEVLSGIKEPLKAA